MKECLIDINLAIALKGVVEAMDLKAPLGIYGFTCPKCRQPVRAHKDGQAGQGPHFEHIPGNEKNCHT